MTHDVANEYARCFIGEPYDGEKVPANLACRLVAVREAQRARFRANAGGKGWVSLRQHRKLHLSGHTKFFAHLLVLGVDLSLRLLQTSNILTQEAMLELHECASEDQAEKRVLLIHKQYVVMKRFLAAGGYFFEDGGDRTLDRNTERIGQEMVTDWFSRKEREAIS